MGDSVLPTLRRSACFGVPRTRKILRNHFITPNAEGMGDIRNCSRWLVRNAGSSCPVLPSPKSPSSWANMTKCNVTVQDLTPALQKASRNSTGKGTGERS